MFRRVLAVALASAIATVGTVVAVATPSAPAQAVGSASSTFVDDLDSFTQTYARSSADNWQTDNSLPTYFDGDDARASRKSTNTPEWLEWSFSNISSFSFRVYYVEANVSTDVTFSTSVDGSTWTAAAVSSDTPAAKGDGWYRVNLTSSGALPVGTNFVRIQLANDPRVWAPQISRASITYTDSTLLNDDLNDFAKTASRTSGWTIDTSQPSYFLGDGARAARTSDTAQSITYHVADALWMKARIFFVDSFAGELVFSTSANGSTWATVATTNTTPVATSGGWYWADFQASSAIPSGTNYIRIQFQNDTRGWAPQLSNVKIAGGAPAPSPRVMTTTYSTQDVPVAIYDVTQFGATPNDSTDATGAFQGALNAAATAGGGVVFAPSGTYHFYGHLSVPVNVTLRGDWKSPDAGGSGVGTILEPHADRDNPNGTAFITTHDGSTVRDLSIWYPDQVNPADVHAYPWMIAASNSTGYGPTVENLTAYNPYQAFNLFLAACTYIHNVFATPLAHGIDMDKIGDVTRFEDVSFRPRYWAGSGLGTPPTEAAITGYTRAHGTGISIERNDWNYMYNIFLEGYDTGVVFQRSPYGIYNGQILNLHTEGGRIGLKLTDLNTNGLAVTNSTINVNGTDGVAVYAPATFTAAMSAAFNNTTLGSPSGKIVQLDGAGSMSFVHSTFTDWSSSTAAIAATAGSVVVQASAFAAAKTAISLGAGVTSASVMANTYTGTPTIANASSGDIKISTSGTMTPSMIPALSTADPQRGTYRKPATATLVDATAAPYGATGDGSTDDTSAIQAALNAAGTAGGGTVYLPGRRYKVLGHLTVPANVELRGASDGPHHYGEGPRGTVLVATENQGNASGAAFIALGASSGVRGLSVYYPNQNYSTVSAYPPTVQGNGTNAYAIDVTLPDSYVGFKMTQGGYYINYARGLGLSEFINVSGVSTAGYIVNTMNTVGDWQDLDRDSSAPPRDWWMAVPSCLCVGMHIDNTDNAKLFGTFSFAIAYGLKVSGTSSNLDNYGGGADNSLHGVDLEGSGSNLRFVNLQITAPYTNDKRYIYTAPGYSGSASFFNSQVWAAPSGVELRGTGAVTLVQFSDTPNPGAVAVPVNQYAGTLTMDASTIAQTGPQVHLGAGIAGASLYGNSGNGGFSISDDKGVTTTGFNILR